MSGLRVIDAATLFAGPLIATMLGDFGAEVIKIEHPRGDPARGHGFSKDGAPLWWKVLNRNKRCVTLNLSQPEGGRIFQLMAADADVLIENFRPGTMERWGLGWQPLHDLNPRLVMVRVTAFGQRGPYSGRPGYGTIAEAMSGFAYITGMADGPPTLPPFGLADGVCAMTGTWAAAFALYHRDARGGEGQMIDLAIYEPLLTLLGSQPTVYDQLGIVQGRDGNRSVNNAPRNTYRTADGRWVAISTSSDSVAARVMRLVGHAEVTNEPWFGSGRGRAAHVDMLDRMVSDWIGSHDLETVLHDFEQAEAAIAPIYDVAQVMSDPHFLHRGSIVSVNDPDLGPLKMQNVIAQMSATPGRIQWTGPGLGAHNEQIYAEGLQFTEHELAELHQAGVV